MRRFLAFAVFAGAFLMLAPPALAQDRAGTWEISPFAGGYFGGRLYGNYTVPFSSGTVSNVRFLEPDDDLAYGARLAYNVTRHFGIEVDWTSSRADLRYPNSFGAVGGVVIRNFKVGTLRQNVYEANALFNFGRRRVIGYVGIGAGDAVLKQDVAGIDPTSKGRFTANLSVGGKFFFVPRVGLRIDGRVRAIDLRSDEGTSCDHNSFCDNRRGNWSYNGEVTGGLVFAF